MQLRVTSLTIYNVNDGIYFTKELEGLNKDFKMGKCFFHGWLQCGNSTV